MSLYLDSSAFVKTLVDEPGSTELLAELAGHRLHFTCEITYAEACAALARAGRLGRLTADDIGHGLGRLNDSWPDLQRLTVSDSLIHDAGELAVRFNLRGYDAVQLAALVQVPDLDGRPLLAAWDTELRTAARSLGFELFPAG